MYVCVDLFVRTCVRVCVCVRVYVGMRGGGCACVRARVCVCVCVFDFALFPDSLLRYGDDLCVFVYSNLFPHVCVCTVASCSTILKFTR